VTESAIPPPPPPPPPAPAAPDRACAECGAELDEHQEVCVECGHAVGPHERRRLRGALRTGSLAAFVVLVGASAAYGLSAGGASNVRDLGVGPKPPTPDTVAQATPTLPPATTSPTPDTVPPATPTPPPASTSSTPATTPTPSAKPKKAAKAKTPATTTPSTPSSTANTPSTTGTTKHHTTHHHHTTTPAKTPPPSWVADGDPPYEAFSYGGGSKPKQAIDGDTNTAFKAGRTGIGVIVDTGQAQPYSSVGIVTSTPGYAVTVYYSNNKTGSGGDPTANGWKRDGAASNVAKYQQVHIKANQARYLLIYITKLPPGKSSAAVNEIKLIL
jgi:hypothetical protein